MNGISDLMKELYALKIKIEGGEDVQSAFASFDLPLADIDETKNAEDAVGRPDEQDGDIIATLLENLRTSDAARGQDVYPLEKVWFAKITDGSIARTGYTSGDGQYNVWEEVTLTADPGEATLTDGRTGDSNNLLVDLNQIDSLPDDTVVRVFAFSYDNGILYYYFSWEGLGTKATPYSIHTDPTSADGLSWDGDSPPNAKDGKTTRYSSMALTTNAGAPGDVKIDNCYWTETVDSEGHDRIVSVETYEGVFWDADNVCCYG